VASASSSNGGLKSAVKKIMSQSPLRMRRAVERRGVLVSSVAGCSAIVSRRG